ncbi:MAG: hypothetical protein A2W25_05295 [candidate division Zixibacteria bacterium RBG_16_53_22]|nr:MAG: hypothetical protein A2W25_05295 [candidate division Zixibacteria bacterium RBG_16_53_22]
MISPIFLDAEGDPIYNAGVSVQEMIDQLPAGLDRGDEGRLLDGQWTRRTRGFYPERNRQPGDGPARAGIGDEACGGAAVGKIFAGKADSDVLRQKITTKDTKYKNKVTQRRNYGS